MLREKVQGGREVGLVGRRRRKVEGKQGVIDGLRSVGWVFIR